MQMPNSGWEMPIIMIESSLSRYHIIKRLAELSPSWSTAHLYLADAYLNSRQYTLALTSYEMSLKHNSKNVGAMYGIGLTYVRLGNKAMADKYAKELRPGRGKGRCPAETVDAMAD